MRLNPSQLSAHLAKTLAPVYVVAGDEPLLVQEALDAIRDAARKAGFAEREVLEVEPGFNWQRLAEACGSLSLFASKRMIELRMPRGIAPGRARKDSEDDDEGEGGGGSRDGVKLLPEIAARLERDTLLIVACGALDKRARESGWFLALEQAGASVYAWPIKPDEQKGWLSARARALGVDLDPDALQLLAERTEGNLLAAAQDLDKLRLLHPGERIGAAQLTEAVADSARFGSFDLIDRVLGGDGAGAVRSLERLREEGLAVLEILGALSWALRQLAVAAQAYARTRDAASACAQARAFGPQAQRMQAALPRVRPTEVLSWLRRAAQIDLLAKSTNGEAAAWEDLLTLTLAASGARRTA